MRDCTALHAAFARHSHKKRHRRTTQSPRSRTCLSNRSPNQLVWMLPLSSAPLNCVKWTPNDSEYTLRASGRQSTKLAATARTAVVLVRPPRHNYTCAAEIYAEICVRRCVSLRRCIVVESKTFRAILRVWRLTATCIVQSDLLFWCRLSEQRVQREKEGKTPG